MKLLVVTQKVDSDDENLGFFHGWILELAKNFESVTVLALRVGETDLPENVKVYSFGQGRASKGGMKTLWAKIKKLYKFWGLFSFHYGHADAVFFHMIPEFILSASPFLIFRKKTACLWYTHKSVTWRLKLAEKLVDFVFTASELSFRLPSKKVIYTGHAIDTELFKPPAEKKQDAQLKLITVGRISPVKDYDTMILACSILKNNLTDNFNLSIIGGPIMLGDKKYFSSLEELIKKLELRDRVILEGPKPYGEMSSIYAGQDLFLSMSATGSIDKSVLEAMSSGLSVITANEAFRSFLPPKYFLEKRDPELLAAKIKELATEPRPNEVLRNIVVKHHSLHNTIGGISKIIKNKKSDKCIPKP